MYLASINESVHTQARTPLMRERDRERLGIGAVADNGASLCAHEQTEPKTTARSPIAMEAARLTETIRTERRRAQNSDTPDHFYVFTSWSSDEVLYTALAALNKEGVRLGSMTIAGDRWSLYMLCERVEQEDTRSYYDMLPCDV